MSTNAVIYARFSSDKQREESIDGQIRECKAFAQDNQLNVSPFILTEPCQPAQITGRTFCG